MHGFYVLPSEMVDEIISYLRPTDMVNLVFSSYHLLCFHGLAPRLSIDRLATLLAAPTLRGDRVVPPLYRLPTELLIYTMSKMDPLGLATFVFAQYPHLLARGIAPALSGGMSPQFIKARNRAIRS